MTEKLVLDRAEFRDKVYACWLGKNIGGTLGAPYECKKEKLELTFYDPLPTEAAPNDDLDLQLVWLAMLRERGVYPTLTDFADYWKRHLSPYPYNEYGFCRRNLERRLAPPISGCFENYYIDEMGSPIRSEIWACVAPGDPQLAAYLAWDDSALDHAGGEGTYGEMFWAAAQSAAFVVSDPRALIRIGLAMIPLWSRTARVVREAVWLRDNGIDWDEARARMLRSFGHFQSCQAPQNIGFTIVGWLYGEDFGDMLLKAVNCGYDTDCTAATLGATLGIIGGTQAIPARWSEPVGEGIVLHKFTRDLDAPRTIDELTDQTIEVAEKMVAQRSPGVEFGAATKVPNEIISRFLRDDLAVLALSRDPQSAIATVEGYAIALHYGAEPVLREGEDKILGVSIKRNDEAVAATVQLLCPSGWEVQNDGVLMGQQRFRVRAESVNDGNELCVRVQVAGKSLEWPFVILGPQAATGYPCGVQVPKCRECNACLEECMCA